jgi:hypothetical protein
MIQYKKIQKFLPPSYEEELFNTLSNAYFPWYWNESVTYTEEQENVFQFIHSFVMENQITSEKVFPLIAPMVHFFEKAIDTKIKSINRLKANLTTRCVLSEADIKSLYHTDIEESNYVSFIYYVNDSDGDTIVGNESCPPEKNSLIWFKSNILHAGMFPKINKRRIIISGVLEI